MKRLVSWFIVMLACADVHAQAEILTTMADISAGFYQPQFGNKGELVAVPAFRLDVYAVSNAEFLAFVNERPQWTRSQVTGLFADAAYLSHWQDDHTLGPLAAERAPVTNVSWFAAKAYCQQQAKRLPSMDEWEYVAAAGLTTAKPPDLQAFNRRILDWYAKPSRLPLPAVGYSTRNYWGVWDMHGLVWEWVSDFNALLTSRDSRQDATGLDAQLFCAAGSVGSADPSDYAAFMRYAMRGSSQARYAMQNLGFRCAADADAREQGSQP